MGDEVAAVGGEREEVVEFGKGGGDAARVRVPSSS